MWLLVERKQRPQPLPWLMQMQIWKRGSRTCGGTDLPTTDAMGPGKMDAQGLGHGLFNKDWTLGLWNCVTANLIQGQACNFRGQVPDLAQVWASQSYFIYFDAI